MLWGKSADDIAKAFEKAGFKTTVRVSRSGKAKIVEVAKHPAITQIQVHPGGGRHVGAHVKISTSTKGKIKVVDSATYVADAAEKATIVGVR